MKSQLISSANFFKSVKNTVYLFKKLWKENTTALLHAPRNVDKTAKAVEIAADIIASGRKVVYVNTSGSLSDHADSIENMENLFVYTPAYDSSDDPTDYADLVISGIEEIVAETDIRTFIIDSVTRIAALSFGRNASPTYVMKRLVALQLRHKLSFLVIAHDTTKSTDRALLTLASSEIAATSAPADPSELSELSDSSESSDLSDFSDSSPSLPTVTPATPRQKLTRKERRLLRRNKKTKLFVK